jgi:hypothetical protein
MLARDLARSGTRRVVDVRGNGVGCAASAERRAAMSTASKSAATVATAAATTTTAVTAAATTGRCGSAPRTACSGGADRAGNDQRGSKYSEFG